MAGMRASFFESPALPRLPVDTPPRLIGIVGFDGVATLDLIGPLEAFKAARNYDNYHRAHACYEVVILGLTKKTFVSESGVVFQADKTIEETFVPDTLIIPGGNGSRAMTVRSCISDWLRAQEGRIRRIASVCTGIYPLADSGLTDGREIVTHWRCASEVASRFPQLRVNQTASFLKDGRIYTCGGGKAGLEMTLAMIDEDYGSQVAREVAREFVLRLKPSGAEKALVGAPKGQWESSERMADLPGWILSHLDGDLSIEVLADKCALCPRHFSRLFKRVFKTTPAEFVERLRLGEARRRLLMPDTTIKCVAEAVGFRSAEAFRRAFERELEISPSAFRMRFQQRVETDVRTRKYLRKSRTPRRAREWSGRVR
jgi:transcriptional regulator GlxA family with amidase domain